jgi:hypothetical protein
MDTAIVQETDTRYLAAAAVGVAAVIILLFFALSGMADDTGPTTNPGEVEDDLVTDGQGGQNLYAVQDGVVILYPEQYVAGTNSSVSNGTFRIQYTYEDSSYGPVYKLKGKYQGRPVGQWGYEQTDDDLRLSTTIDPNDGIANAFVFPPKQIRDNGGTRIDGIAVVDAEFQERATNITIARYDGFAEPFNGAKIADGVYLHRYTVEDLQNFLERGNRRIMVGDIQTTVYHRIDSDGIGAYIDE